MNWKRLSVVLFFLLAMMTVADILLIRQNVEMRRLLPSNAKGAKVGAQLPPFSAKGLWDQSINVRYDGSGPRRVYFYFTPTCKFCHQQFAYWKEILQQSANHNLEVMGLVKEGEDQHALNAYLQQMGCSNESSTPLKVVFVSDRIRHDYGLSATPVTLLTDNRGAVEKSWVGAWTEAERKDAASALQLTISPQ